VQTSSHKKKLGNDKGLADQLKRLGLKSDCQGGERLAGGAWHREGLVLPGIFSEIRLRASDRWEHGGCNLIGKLREMADKGEPKNNPISTTIVVLEMR